MSDIVANQVVSLLRPLLSFAAVLLLWSGLSALALFPETIVPSPWSVWAAAVDMASSGVLQSDLAISAGRAAAGFVIGASLGVVTGLFNRANCAISPLAGALFASDAAYSGHRAYSGGDCLVRHRRGVKVFRYCLYGLFDGVVQHPSRHGVRPGNLFTRRAFAGRQPSAGIFRGGDPGRRPAYFRRHPTGRRAGFFKPGGRRIVRRLVRHRLPVTGGPTIYQYRSHVRPAH